MKSQSILLVDDDGDDQVLFVDALSLVNSNIECNIVNNGLEALLSLRSKTPIPDIIFLDLNMPKMNGYECLAEIKNEVRLRHIPVVIYSTSKTDSDKQLTLEMGAKYFFTKPGDFTALMKELGRILSIELA